MPATVTWRSSMASSSAACTLAGARLISSASTMLAKIGPGSKRKLSWPSSEYSTSVPVTSDGSRSGVNWMRLKSASSSFARLLTARVLAKPGRPSTSR